jgi:predicted Na+-dependent transporter
MLIFLSPNLSFQWISVHSLAMIPFMKVSKAKKDGSFDGVSAESLLLIVAWGGAIHLLFMIVNMAAATAFQFPLEQKKSVVIQCSQKTLPVSLTIVAFLPESAGDAGLLAIPCIIAQFTQMMIDSFIAVRWNETNSKMMDEAGKAEEGFDEKPVDVEMVTTEAVDAVAM